MLVCCLAIIGNQAQQIVNGKWVNCKYDDVSLSAARPNPGSEMTLLQ